MTYGEDQKYLRREGIHLVVKRGIRKGRKVPHRRNGQEESQVEKKKLL